MIWLGKKSAVFGLLLLLLGGTRALACEEPFMLDGPGSVYEPPPLSEVQVRSQLQIAMANRSRWDLVQKDQGPTLFAVTDLDRNGKVEILSMTQAEGVLHGFEVQAERGELEKVSPKWVMQIMQNQPHLFAWFTITDDPGQRKAWLESDPSHNIRMLLDSYEIFAGKKEGFG